jgi:hypothetical protein
MVMDRNRCGKAAFAAEDMAFASIGDGDLAPLDLPQMGEEHPAGNTREDAG